MRGGVFLGGASDDFVVDIGVIAHEEDVVAGMSEESAQDVKDDEGAGMSDMGQVIDGEAAHIDGDFGWVERNKIDLVASGRIIETNGNHGISFINIRKKTRKPNRVFVYFGEASQKGAGFCHKSAGSVQKLNVPR